jgi:hypothetical protein
MIGRPGRVDGRLVADQAGRACVYPQFDFISALRAMGRLVYGASLTML